ncbi:MAG TPA: glycosyltransferase [Ktedonobacterales bacterium]|nr:glycosyltransferase [Ktedonobacterales bacterium]
MSTSHVHLERAEWRGVVIEGLTRAIEGFFLLTLVAAPLDAYLTLPSGLSLGFLSQALTAEMCVLFGLTLALGALLKQPTALRVRAKELAPLALALLAALASTVMATSHSVALKESLKVLVYLGLFMVGRALEARPQARYRALLALLAGMVIVLIVGFFGAVPGLPDVAGALLNIQRTPAALPHSLVQRAASTFRYPNELAAYLTLIIPLLTACAVTTRDMTERVGFLLLACGAGALLLMTYTRGALLGVSVALVVLLWALGGYRFGLGGAALVLGCMAALVVIPGPISTRIITAFTASDGWQGFRLEAWRWAVSIFLHHPLVGVGIGNISLQPGAPLVSGARELDAESLALNVLAEMGVVGALAVGLCLVAAIRLTISGLRASRSWLDRAWNAGALAALAGVIIYGLSDPVLVSGQVTEILCALVGLAGVTARIPRTPRVGVAAPDAEAVRVSRIVPVLESPVLEKPVLEKPVLEEPVLALSDQRRIVFLLNSRDLGGSEIHTINLACALERLGLRTLTIVPPKARAEALLVERALPYRVERLGMNVGRGKGLLGVLSLLNPVRRLRAAHVIGALADETPSVFVCPFPREQALMTRMKRRRELRVVWIIHAPLHYLPHRLIIQPMLRTLSRRADLIVAISQTLAARLTEQRFAAGRLVVIPNAVAATPGDAAATNARPPATIGYAGRLTARKGVATLIEALAEVHERWPDAMLLIAGAGPEEMALRRQVERLGLAFHVVFLGQVSDMAAFYRRLTVFALPTADFEGLPTVILEAQSTGAPVIASAVDGVTEVITDQVTGLLTWPGDTHALAEAILTLLDQPDLARRLALTGWRQVRARYTLDRAAARFAEAVAHLDAPPKPELSWQTESSKMRVAHRSRFLRDTGILLAGKVFTALATALWTVLAARSLPPSSYGDLMLCAGMVDIAAVITDAGLTVSATQELAMASPQRARRLIGTVFWLKLALGAVASGVALGALVMLPFTPVARSLMLLLAPGLVFISLNSLSLLFRARLDTGYTLVAAAVSTLAGGYGAFSVYLSAPTADGFARVRLLMLAVGGALTLTLVAVKYRPGWGFDWAFARRLLGASALLGLALALNILYYRIDVPLLALIAGSGAVATYTSAYRVLDVATLLPVTAATAALPLLSAQRSKRSLSAFVSQYLELALVFGLLIAATLTSAAHPVLAALYGDRYDAAYPTMVALAWVAGMTLITNVFSPLAVALNRRRLLLGASGVALLVNVALNLLLIPYLGALGSALATLATEVVVTAPLAWTCSRSVAIRPRMRPVIAALSATAAWLWALIALDQRFGQTLGHGWLMTLALLVVWLAVFILIAPVWLLDVARTVRMASQRMGAARGPASAPADATETPADAVDAVDGTDAEASGPLPALAMREGRA